MTPTPKTGQSRGRPTKFTKKVREEIISAVQVGATYEIASNYAGVSYAAFNNWMNRGRAEFNRLDEGRETDEQGNPLPANHAKTEKPFLDFFKAVTEAASVADVNWLRTIDTAASQDPNWAAWMLRVRHPQTYGGRRDMATTVTTKDGTTGTETIIRIQYVDYEPPVKVEEESSPAPPAE